MTEKLERGLVALNHFIQATRDSGYNGTAAALAELVDNSLEAEASRVDIDIKLSCSGESTISITDDGCGMSPSVLQQALRFGGSTRFNSRKGTGRYGMGLPNSSLSSARRVEVYTWTSPDSIWWSYLDVDEITAGHMVSVPKARRRKATSLEPAKRSSSGTIVVWSRCDRLDYKYEKVLTAKLHRTLGQLFRYQLWAGRTLYINGEPVLPIDPLFLRRGNNLVGATTYGPPLNFEISVPNSVSGSEHSTVVVTFTELPIKKWQGFSNEEKRRHGITKGAGVSIVRAGREIDYGWYFFGAKRKENYDDWWRCEVRFGAELDELFGVTNNKQGIRPTEVLKSILTPDMERTAHYLNSRVRKTYLQVKSAIYNSPAQHQAEDRDHLLEPPARVFKGTDDFSSYGLSRSARSVSKRNIVPGLAYRIEHKPLEDDSFFVPLLSSREVVVLLNEEHPFYEKVYSPIAGNLVNPDARKVYRYLELMLFAAARAECSIADSNCQEQARNVREAWSHALATFLE